jgi:hypothetical protein
MKGIRKNPAKQTYDGTQRRERFRVEYPITERPKLILDHEEDYEVIDLCEDGVRFFNSRKNSFLAARQVHGKIQFHDEQSVEIEGTILRIDNQIIVLVLSQKIPYKIIVTEELYLRKKKVNFSY